jgi:gliding motility-associated-like protein
MNKKIRILDDYWYTIELQNGKIIKGHFALKR